MSITGGRWQTHTHRRPKRRLHYIMSLISNRTGITGWGGQSAERDQTIVQTSHRIDWYQIPINRQIRKHSSANKDINPKKDWHKKEKQLLLTVDVPREINNKKSQSKTTAEKQKPVENKKKKKAEGMNRFLNASIPARHEPCLTHDSWHNSNPLLYTALSCCCCCSNRWSVCCCGGSHRKQKMHFHTKALYSLSSLFFLYKNGENEYAKSRAE